MSSKQKGIILAILGASLWGTSGVAVQYLYAHAQINTAWLVAQRLLGAGILLSIWSHYKYPGEISRIIKKRTNWIRLILFSLIGVGGSQFTYFVAVSLSNAPTATTIQFLSPIIIIAYTAIAKKALPRRIDVFSVVIAIMGTFMLITGGHLDRLSLSVEACIWGLLAAFCTAMEVVIPEGLMQRYQTVSLIGTAMIISEFAFLPNLVLKPWPQLTFFDWGLVVYIVIAGTLFAYLFFLASTRYISTSLTGMLGAFEPLVATVLAVALLGTSLSVDELIGGGCIIAVTILQAWAEKKGILKQSRGNA
ncbi:DMT family transporter [Ligilactobacillus sp. WILCCON 0076]|uniref:DMT family transporter n=1 Tax=Ligilactobacillus ubinensis TaxID=2876789 RepID=A0A9X2JK17_9LACO|nr:EamA family transporter [Ligilactobacillus ubinensis]MCP0885809.1 DMT family transporter [Ligilactobacillus ubinensis]